MKSQNPFSRLVPLLLLATLSACGGGAATVSNTGAGNGGGSGGVGGSTPGTLALSAASYGFAQSAGTATLVVSRASGTSGAVSVQYSTSNGTAVAGTNYTATSGTLNWADGDAASKNISVPLGATGFSGSKTFSVALATPTGSATLGTPAMATVTVNGSVAAASGTLALGAATVTVAQAAGMATLSVSRTGGSTGAITVHYATANGTAVAGTDYTAASGTLSWADGDAAAKSIPVALGATAFSGTKAFSVAISAPTGGATLATPATETVTITGSAAAAPGTLALANATLSVSQASGTATLNVTRTGGSSGAVTVHYATANGTGVAGTDYTAASGTLSWADGDAASKSIAVALNTTAFSGSKTFSVAISAPTGSATLGTVASTTVTILGSASSGSLAIRASGNKLVDASNATVQLRGVNISGLEYVAVQGWSPTNPWGPNTPNFTAMKTWGINSVRIPLNEDSWLGYTCSDGKGTNSNADPGGNYVATVMKAVSDANAAGLYVILDLHWTAPNMNGAHLCATYQMPMADLDNSLTFWTSIANTFKGNPSVIFELFNEPFLGESTCCNSTMAAGPIVHGGTVEPDYFSGGTQIMTNWTIAGMQQMLDAVRAAGASNVVLIGTDNWTQQMNAWLPNVATDPAHQLGASWHPYPYYPSGGGAPQVLCIGIPSCSAVMMSAVQGILAAGYPVVATEYGDNITGSPGASSPWAQIFLPWADTNGVSYMGWTWNAFSGNSNYLITSASGTPSNGFGTYVKQHYLCVAAGTTNCP